MKTVRFLLAITLAFVAGCCVNNVRHFRLVSKTDYPHIDIINYCYSLAETEGLWRREIARRFPDAVVVMGHGGDFMGQWMLRPDTEFSATVGLPLPPIPVTTLIMEAKARFPGRLIVVISCNPGHYRLGIPGVAYATEDIWIIPDKVQSEREEDPAFGTIYEFEYNP